MRRQQRIRLVLRAQSGDRTALDALLGKYQSPLFDFIHALVPDRQLAEDVLQETFLLIVRKLYWLREPAAFSTWAYRIASRQAFRSLRRQRRRVEHHWEDMDEVSDSDAESSADPELLDRLADLLEDVSPASRAVLSLHYLHEMSLAEVGSVLDVSIGTVKSRLAYGLKQLRARLASASSPAAAPESL